MRLNILAACMIVMILLAGLAPAISTSDVLLPPEGAALNRIHVQFRWPPFARLIGDYRLVVVVDDGSADPFAGGIPVVDRWVDAEEPREIVTEGLAFDTSYAWRVSGLVGPSASAPGPTQLTPARRRSPIHRFETLPLPSFYPPTLVTVPPGAGPMEPGVTLFNYGSAEQTFPGGFITAVDEDGNAVYFQHRPEGGYIGDVRLLDLGRGNDGRFLLIRAALAGDGGDVFETTLDGKDVWQAGEALLCHHEVFPMPSGNSLTLVQEPREVCFGGSMRTVHGDRVVEYDRITEEIVWSWSTHDHYSYEDFAPGLVYTDWTHTNSCVYVPWQNSVYISVRHLSRITRIDYATGDIVYNMGQDMPSGDVPFGDNMISWQHAPQILDNGNIVLYDNGNRTEPLTDPRRSRGIEIALDDLDAPTSATIAWEYVPIDDNGDPIYTAGFGDADRLSGGNTLVCAGGDGIIDEADAQGNLVWRINVGLVGGFPAPYEYRSERVQSLVVDTPGDFDGDSDLDLIDFAELSTSFTGSGPQSLSFPATLIDHDRDDDIDHDDVDLFSFWLTGPGI